MKQSLSQELFNNRQAFKNKYLRNIQEYGVVIYGTGELAVKFYMFLTQRNIRVKDFIDHDPLLWGEELFGHIVKSLDEIDTNYTVVVAIWSPNHSFKATKRSLEQIGFKNILPPLSISFLYDAIGSIHYQIGEFSLYEEDTQKVKSILNCIISEKSKILFKNYINWRISLDEKYLPPPKQSPKYFSEDIFWVKNFKFLIDGGSYDGDTVKDFIFCKGNRFEKIYCFEPDEDSFHKLSLFGDKLGKHISEKITMQQCGLGNKMGTAYFEKKGKLGSKITKCILNNKVELITIDSLNLEFIDFIKLDIEGSETEALEGARTTLTNFHPSLAVSIYHNPRDFIDIPYLILDQFYYPKFEIVQYDNDGIDLTLLATY